MLSKVDFEHVKIVVELGPGTGVLTGEILARLRPDVRLIVVESNASFCEKLQNITDARLSVYCDSAENLSQILDAEKADIIFSGIPFTSLGKVMTATILDAVKGSLASDGALVQFQYSRLSRKAIADRFDHVEIDFVPLNIPPAFVYVAR